jgi:hypothetical protein
MEKIVLVMNMVKDSVSVEALRIRRDQVPLRRHLVETMITQKSMKMKMDYNILQTITKRTLV